MTNLPETAEKNLNQIVRTIKKSLAVLGQVEPV